MGRPRTRRVPRCEIHLLPTKKDLRYHDPEVFQCPKGCTFQIPAGSDQNGWVPEKR